jgi:hypothetical protein
MATSPVPLWAQEMSPYHRGPTGAGVLALAIVVVLVGLLFGPQLTTDSGQSAGPRWQQPSCAERDRLLSYGTTSGPSYRRVAAACREASSGR